MKPGDFSLQRKIVFISLNRYSASRTDQQPAMQHIILSPVPLTLRTFFRQPSIDVCQLIAMENNGGRIFCPNRAVPHRSRIITPVIQINRSPYGYSCIFRRYRFPHKIRFQISAKRIVDILG